MTLRTHPWGRKGLFLWPCFACFMAGLVSSYAMAPTYFWPSILVGIGILYYNLSIAPTKTSSFLYGWLFGFGYFIFGLHWIGNALLVDGNPYAWAWPLAVAGLPFLLSFFPGFACLLSKAFLDLKHLAGFFACVCSLAASEWLRGHILTGFPWNLYGYAWGDQPLILQSVSLINSYGLTAVTILWGCFLGFLLLKDAKGRHKLLILAVCLLTAVGLATYGNHRLAVSTDAVNADQTFNIRLVQPNIPQDQKWDRQKLYKHFSKILHMSMAESQTQNVDLIVWPETAINQRLLDDPLVIDAISNMLNSYDPPAALLTGALRYNRDKEAYYNSMISIDSAGNISNIYDKHHLVPFGEYIPFQNWIPLTPIVEFSGFQAGRGPQTFDVNNISYSPAVCYEIIFPGTLIAETLGAEHHRPHFIVNVTNDAWYGQSAGPYQHYGQAVFRATEEQTRVIRVANTGISDIITPFGYSMEKSALFTDFSEVFSIRPTTIGKTKQISESHAFYGFIVIILFGAWYNVSTKKYLKL